MQGACAAHLIFFEIRHNCAPESIVECPIADPLVQDQCGVVWSEFPLEDNPEGPIWHDRRTTDRDLWHVCHQIIGEGFRHLGTGIEVYLAQRRLGHVLTNGRILRTCGGCDQQHREEELQHQGDPYGYPTTVG